MVAAQAYIDHAKEHDERLRRAQLMVTPPSEPEGVPADVRANIEAIHKMIDDDALRPVVEAATIEEADERAINGFETFKVLWTAAISARLPWLQNHPSQAGRIASVVRRSWQSEQAISTLGEAACEWFGAAQTARQALTRVGHIEANRDEIATYTLLADYAFSLGLFMLKTVSRPVEGLPLQIARLAHASATKAFALATQHLYADPTP
jgi:hypothetical protein